MFNASNNFKYELNALQNLKTDHQQCSQTLAASWATGLGWRQHDPVMAKDLAVWVADPLEIVVL